MLPCDAQLNLPRQSYSHRLQKRAAAKAAKKAFESVASDIETETGVRMSSRQIKEIIDLAAPDFDAFYAQPCSQEIAPHAAAKSIQVLTFDGKGVVMRRETLREATRKRAEASARQAPRGFARQDKSNRKRMATVAGLYHLHRQVRSPQSVAQPFALPQPRQAAP